MFVARQENREAVHRLLVALSPRPRGDLISHEAAASILGVPQGENKYYGLVERVRKRLEEERGITLISDIGIGYRLATASGQLESGQARNRRATRQIRRARRVVESLPDEECSTKEREAKFIIVAKLSEIEHQQSRNGRLMAFLLRSNNDRTPLHPRMPEHIRE